MKITVLMDNNTLIDRYFIAEPAVSYLIEHEDKKILFDARLFGCVHHQCAQTWCRSIGP